MARPSRTSSIVADTGVGATGLTISAAIDTDMEQMTPPIVPEEPPAILRNESPMAKRPNVSFEPQVVLKE